MKIDVGKLDVKIAESEMMIKDLCKKAEIGENAFRAIRKGKSEPRLATIGRIANALGVSVKDVIVQEGNDD